MKSDNLRPLNHNDRQKIRELTLQAVMALYCEDESGEAEIIELRAPSSPAAA